MNANMASAIKLSRILHAGYVFEYMNTKIAFDTIFENPFSRNCYAFPDVRFDYQMIPKLKFDAIFISHFHDDHCSLESLNYLDRKTPLYIFCIHSQLLDWIKQLGFIHVNPLILNQSVVINQVEVIPRPALDIDVDSIFHIKAAGLNILNVVDSWIDYDTLEQLAKYAPWDLILWPFQTMQELEVISPSKVTISKQSLPPEWIQQLKILKPKYIVPSSCQFIHESWSWYKNIFFPITYKQFQHEINEALPTAQVIRMNPSTSIMLNQHCFQPSDSLPWVIPIGDQEVDYEYNPYVEIPLASEVAKHFNPISEPEMKIIDIYCTKKILEIYQQLSIPDESYFNDCPNWQLSILDHEVQAINYFYQIISSEMRLIDKPAQIHWLTEVPAFKMYAALTNGESLSSMYVRINDTQFSPNIENKIQNTDLMEDPLLRCLFEGQFGQYQLAQLNELKLKEI